MLPNNHIQWTAKKSGKLIEKLDQKEIVDFKELLLSEIITTDALVNLLDRKGIISKHELIEEMQGIDVDFKISQIREA